MMPIPVPVGREPESQYIQVSFESANRFRKRLLLVGVISVIAGPILVVTGITWGFQMLVADRVMIAIGAMSIAISALFVIVNGVCVLGVRSQVSAEHVNISSVRVSRRLLIVFWVLIIVLDLWGSFFLMVAAGQTNYPPVSGIAASPTSYLWLALAAVVIGGVDFFMGNRLVRFTRKKAIGNGSPQGLAAGP